jgi:serine/threonine-protein kinase
VLADKYRIEALIGRGGMGAVYRATHVVMDKPVAVKWLFPDFNAASDARQRFIHEARAAARIRHPNVVDVYDVGEEQGALYMVMELLEGESFEVLIQRGQIAIPDMLQLLTQAMRGVAAAHAKGIVHRDIKPENIFVVGDPSQPSGHSAKVLDFGVSKLGDEARRNPGLTKTGMVMGTPLYMSLEQMNGARDVDGRTDIYAFGVLLYRALTGHLPFHGDTFAALAVAVATHTPTAPRALRPDLPKALSELVVKAMARKRDDRYPTLEAMLQDLSSLSTSAGYLGQMTQPSTLPPSLTPVSRERLRADPLPVPEPSLVPPAFSVARSGPGAHPARTRRLVWAMMVAIALGVGLIAALASRSREQAASHAPLPPAQRPSTGLAAPTPPVPSQAPPSDWDNTGVVAEEASTLPMASEPEQRGAPARDEASSAEATSVRDTAVKDAEPAGGSRHAREKHRPHEATPGPTSPGPTLGGAAGKPGSSARIQGTTSAAPVGAPAIPTTAQPAQTDKTNEGPAHRSGGVRRDEL